jgi:hypothetical protein
MDHFLGIRVGSVSDPEPDPDWIRTLSGQWIRIRLKDG